MLTHARVPRRHTVQRRRMQAVAIAALYLACKVDEVSGSGAISAPDAASTEVATPQSAHDQQGASNTICQPGAGEDPFPERDRGSLRLLLKQALACDATMRSGDGGTDCDAAQVGGTTAHATLCLLYNARV
jgi:Cyclin, N-terminal domain